MQGISLGIIGGRLGKGIIGTNLPDKITRVHMTILLQCGGDYDSDSPWLKLDVQDDESDTCTYPSLFDKLQVPQLSGSGCKRGKHANLPPVGKK